MEIKYKKGTFYLNSKDTHIYYFFEGKGFFFPKEILARYFLSLKTKPFVILTGISGTGKTKIAQIFADYMCQDEDEEAKEKRKAFIPVRPDWMDNKGLLGFYNILDQKYHPTRLLNLLLEASDNPGKPYFVILDEMNLAKVEQYFSDFLSIMESRTADRPEGEQITLHSKEKVETDGARAIPGKIHIPSNVFFTGTVNVDETTYMFSPKVLDRANVIEFNEVDLDGYITGVSHDASSYLENPDVRNALIDPAIPPFCSRKDYVKFKDIIEEERNPIEALLSRLKKYNFHFGYRVVNEMSRFGWIAQEASGGHFDLDDAIDIQILQKVLPKFHGTQGKLEEPLADLLYFCFDESYKKENPSEEMIQNAQGFDNDASYPRSARKIARMIKNLKTQGYTSFIE
ncbi:MAG: AAA family ATPase [Desulfobacterales bacterium]|nr:AAA family ATPase [Desulfobacterales bacterium]